MIILVFFPHEELVVGVGVGVFIIVNELFARIVVSDKSAKVGRDEEKNMPMIASVIMVFGTLRCFCFFFLRRLIIELISSTSI